MSSSQYIDRESYIDDSIFNESEINYDKKNLNITTDDYGDINRFKEQYDKNYKDSYSGSFSSSYRSYKGKKSVISNSDSDVF